MVAGSVPSCIASLPTAVTLVVETAPEESVSVVCFSSGKVSLCLEVESGSLEVVGVVESGLNFLVSSGSCVPCRNTKIIKIKYGFL